MTGRDKSLSFCGFCECVNSLRGVRASEPGSMQLPSPGRRQRSVDMVVVIWQPLLIVDPVETLRWR